MEFKMKALKKLKRIIPTSLGVTHSVLVHCEKLYNKCSEIINKHTEQIKILEKEFNDLNSSIAILKEKIGKQEDNIKLRESLIKKNQIMLINQNFTPIKGKKHEPYNKCYKRYPR